MSSQQERFCSALHVRSAEEAQVRRRSAAQRLYLMLCLSLQALPVNVANVYLQDVVNALLLCGSAYKAADGGPQAAADALTAWKRQFGGACTLSHVQCALPHVAHR